MIDFYTCLLVYTTNISIPLYSFNHLFPQSIISSSKYDFCLEYFPRFQFDNSFYDLQLLFPTSFIPFTLFPSLETGLYNYSKGELIASGSRSQLFNNFMVTRDLALVDTWLFFLRYSLQILTSILHYFCSCLEVFERRLSVGKLVCCFVPLFLEMMLFLLVRLRPFVTIPNSLFSALSDF